MAFEVAADQARSRGTARSAGGRGKPRRICEPEVVVAAKPDDLTIGQAIADAFSSVNGGKIPLQAGLAKGVEASDQAGVEVHG